MAGVVLYFDGALQVVAPFYVITTTDAPAVNTQRLRDLLFGFDTSEIRWYRLWVAIIVLAYSLFDFFYFGDPVFGVIWLMWSFLWTLFFVLLALEKEISRMLAYPLLTGMLP